jgi:Ser/Thr protein kinase RdoA (MazF antagonist)
MTPDAAARAWDATDPVLLSHRENAVYVVQAPQGRAALRLHRRGYMSAAQIASELWWMQALAARGFPCPAPVPRPDGTLIFQADDAIATMVSWVDGGPIGAGGEPMCGTLTEQRTLMGHVGGLLADMHTITDTLTQPDGFARPAWDLEGFLGPDPTWGPFWENPALTSRVAGLIAEGRSLARTLLEQATAPDMGLIHADMLRENIFSGPRGLTAIDFDDAGVGYRLYDITTALTQSLEDAELPHLGQAIVKGYDAKRTLDTQAIALLPVLSLMRSLAALGWVIPRYPVDHPKMPVYIARATRSILALQSGRNFFLDGFAD